MSCVAACKHVSENKGDFLREIVAHAMRTWIGECVDREELITKTLGILSVTLICVVVLTTPVRATAAAFVVTDPGTLVVLGTALVSVGLGTRKLFRSQKRKP